MIRTDDYSDATIAGGTFRIEDAWTEPDAIGVAVLEAVATCACTDVLELDPLGDVVDVDALNDIFRPRSNGLPRADVTVRFEYEGYDVTIDSDGTVRLRLA